MVKRVIKLFLISAISLVLVGCSTENIDTKDQTNIITTGVKNESRPEEELFADMTPERFAELTETEYKMFRNTDCYKRDVWEVYENDSYAQVYKRYPIVWTDVEITDFTSVEELNAKCRDIISSNEGKMYEVFLEEDSLESYGVKVPLYSLPTEINAQNLSTIDTSNELWTISPQNLPTEERASSRTRLDFNSDVEGNRTNSISTYMAILENKLVWEVTIEGKSVCDAPIHVEKATELKFERTPKYKVIYYGENFDNESYLHCHVYFPDIPYGIYVKIYGRLDSEINMQEAAHNAINKLFIF